MTSQDITYIENTLKTFVNYEQENNFQGSLKEFQLKLKRAKDNSDKQSIVDDFHKNYIESYYDGEMYNNTEDVDALFENIRKKYFVEELHKLKEDNARNEDIQGYLTKINPKKQMAYCAAAAALGASVTIASGALLHKALKLAQPAIDAKTIWIEGSKGTTEQIGILTKTSGVTNGYYETVPGTPPVEGNITPGEEMLVAMVILLVLALTAYIMYNRYEAYGIESTQKKKLNPSVEVGNLASYNADTQLSEFLDLKMEDIQKNINAQKGVKNMADYLKKRDEKSSFLKFL